MISPTASRDVDDLGEFHDIDTESHDLLPRSENEQSRVTRKDKYLPVLFGLSLSVNIMLGVYSLLLWARPQSTVEASYGTGFATDLVYAKPEIELIQVSFDGGVQLDEDGHFFTQSSGDKYVGTPTPSKDRAWDELLAGLNIDLDDTDPHSGLHTYEWEESGLAFTGLEVFHSLHCLNRLRMALYPSFYPGVDTDPNDPSAEDHIGHCINHLRQVIQCHSDLTPMEWKVVGNKIMHDPTTPHTCRNFDKIHEWAKQKQTNLYGIEAVRNGSLWVVC